MTTSVVDTVNVVDGMVSNIQSSLKYAVYSSAQTITPYSYKAISASPNGINFNVQLPSEQTLLYPRIMIRSKPILTMTVKNDSGAPLTLAQILGWGGQGTPPTNPRTALGPFPLHQLFSTIQVTLNNNTFDCNINQILHAFLRLEDYSKSQLFNSTTPTYPDYFANYNDCVGLVADPLASFGNSMDINYAGRGSYPVSFTPALSTSVANGGTQAVDIEFEISEALMCSPFCWNEDMSHRSWMYGLQSFNIQINCNSVVNRAIRSTLPASSGSNAGYLSLVIKNLDETHLDLVYATPKINQLLPATNCHPYCQFLDNHMTTFTLANNNVAQQLQSQAFSLNMIPDGVFICVKKKQGSQTINDPDFYLPIEGVNITFNNVTGILSTARKEELFARTVKNGVHQSYLQFRESMNVFSSGASQSVRTVGSLLYLKFGFDINLPEVYSAPGAIGQYMMQYTLTVKNNTGGVINSGDYDLETIFVNSGNAVLQRGTCSTYIGLLTKEIILNTLQQPQYSRSDVQRLVGGGFFDTLKNIASKVVSVAKPLVKAAEMLPLPGPLKKAAEIANVGLDVASKAGLGEGGAITGGMGQRRRDPRLM